MSQKVLWNKETDQAVKVGDTLKSFRGELHVIEYWNSNRGNKVCTREKTPGAPQLEYYHTVFPALEWREI